MYQCHSAKKFLRRLLFYTVIFCTVFFITSKSFSGSSIGKTNEKPVFLPVIMYHSVFSGTPSDYIVTPSQLENDLQWLKINGYESVTAAQLIDYTRNRGELPEKPVLITLDDGYYNNLSELLPLLEKYDMNAIVSVVGCYTDTIAEADPHVSAYSYMTWEDIKSLSESGRIEIGNHTYDMHSLDGIRKGCAKIKGETNEEYSNTLRSDIELMQTEIHRHINITPIIFAYPFGEISREALPVLRECGFLMTLNCSERPNYITRDPDCLYGIFRYNRSGLYSTEEFMKKITKE